MSPERNRIISPHLDDAVLSLGQHMATKPMHVVTVCAGHPADGILSAYDEGCGFASSHDAMTARRAEDTEACGTLRARAWHLDFLDAQYGPDIDETAMTAALRVHLSHSWHTFAPLGIAHPDHELVARCARAACPEGGELLLYEELPARVTWPELAHHALEQVRAEGFTIDALPFPLLQGDRSAKERAIGCYRSQFPEGAVDPCLLVPERVWRATR